MQQAVKEDPSDLLGLLQKTVDLLMGLTSGVQTSPNTHEVSCLQFYVPNAYVHSRHGSASLEPQTSQLSNC